MARTTIEQTRATLKERDRDIERHTLRASLSVTFLQRKDVVNQCLEFERDRDRQTDRTNERTNDFFLLTRVKEEVQYTFFHPALGQKHKTTKTIENKIIVNSKTHINY